MEKKDVKIIIVGAGLSGLSAALNLEKAGYSPVIYEATSEVGGKVKTDLFQGYQLDHGFQVLLDAYPVAKDYFDYKTLELQQLLPGAQIFREESVRTLGDPSRHFPFLMPTLEAGIASLRDMYLLWRLHRELQGMGIEEIFQLPEMTTAAFLDQRGFTPGIRQNFFKPFFSGIFLEPDLNTSCRMFCFVFKMFGKGNAVIPKRGMSALPEQLMQRLQKTKFHFQTPVKKVEDGKVTLADGNVVKADLVLIATEPHDLLPGSSDEIKWYGCDTLYFEAGKRSIHKPMIGLVAEPDALINNIFYPTTIQTAHKGKKELLSVTIVREHDLPEKALIERVEEELKRICNIREVRFLKRYQIRKALPVVDFSQANLSAAKLKISPQVFLAGDHLLYGSSNAALLSGESAARAMISSLENQK